MLVVAAILLTAFVLSPPWGAVVIIGAVAVEASKTAFWFWYSRRRPSAAGAEAMVGAQAEVVSACRPDGWVRIHGELWRARSAVGAEVGDTVRVRNVEDLKLHVDRE